MNYLASSAAQSEHITTRVARTDSRFHRNYSGLLASLGCAAFLLVSSPALAQVLGAAQSFAILGGKNPGVTFASPTNFVNGDVGIAPTAMTGITGTANAILTPPFTYYAPPDSDAARAATLALYNSAVMAPGGLQVVDNFSLDGPDPLNPGRYTPGKYSNSVAGGVAIMPAGIVLDGPGVYIFTLANALTANGNVTYINGADPCSVYWRVPTLATLNLDMLGTIVAGTGVHMGAGATLIGRALASETGDVTLAGGNTVGGCSAAKLSLVKQVNGGAATVADFPLTAQGDLSTGSTLISGISGTAAVTAANAPVGDYTLTEIPFTGYTAGSFICSNNSVPLSGSPPVLTIAAADTGKTIICTITNTFNVPPTLIKTFNPSSISAGGNSLLTITVSNNNATAATLTSDLADTLTGMTTVGSPTTTCGGTAPTVTASTVTLPIGATIPGGAPGTCTVTVNVTAPAGSYLNRLEIGALATDKGSNAAPATATLTVTKATTTLSTVASSTVTLGGAISDTATLSGGVAPIGTITFNLYAPSDTECTGTPVSSSTAEVSGNGGGYTSASFPSAAIGTYHWIANYGGDANNAATANGCGAANEYVNVTAVATVTAIPTLSEWAMIALAGLLAIVGFVSMRRRVR